MPQHVIVDGSNLATEGRTMPSLKQLNEAVAAYRGDHPDALITVVVDATFGHRIDPKEVAAFDKAIASNEFVAPPAGAVGRGDGFVLNIAQKVKASILSNDSYQEFHGEFPWLFDEGRLIGGKPVPHVGWVFVNRVPVRGPVSRRSVKEQKVVDKDPSRGRSRGRGTAKASPAADAPMPVPKAPPPGAVMPPAPKTTNDLLDFLSFVEHYPVGTAVTAVVESYSSHGAYVAIGDVKGYVPLRLMAEPAPRSAREVMDLGERVTLVVASFAAARRSIDLAVPGMVAPAPPPAEGKGRRAAKKPAPGTDTVPADAAAAQPARAAADKPAGRGRGRQQRAPQGDEAPPPAEQPAERPAEGRAAGRPPRKSASKKTVAVSPAQAVADMVAAAERPAEAAKATKSAAKAAKESGRQPRRTAKQPALAAAKPAKQPAAPPEQPAPAAVAPIAAESTDTPPKKASRSRSRARKDPG